MTAKHTPGPWTTDPEVGHESVIDGEGRLIADCAIFGHGFKRELNVANARLISAAPDLLTALRIVQVAAINQRGLDFNLTTEEWAVFRAAIAKATGAAA